MVDGGVEERKKSRACKKHSGKLSGAGKWRYTWYGRRCGFFRALWPNHVLLYFAYSTATATITFIDRGGGIISLISAMCWKY